MKKIQIVVTEYEQILEKIIQLLNNIKYRIIIWCEMLTKRYGTGWIDGWMDEKNGGWMDG